MLNSDRTDEGVTGLVWALRNKQNVVMGMKSTEDEYDYKFELCEEQFVILHSQRKKVYV